MFFFMSGSSVILESLNNSYKIEPQESIVTDSKNRTLSSFYYESELKYVTITDKYLYFYILYTSGIKLKGNFCIFSITAYVIISKKGYLVIRETFSLSKWLLAIFLWLYFFINYTKSEA